MTKPFPSLLNQQSLHVLGVCDVMQVFVGDIVRPEYPHYLSQTNVAEKNILILVEEKKNNVIQSFCHIT
jgi:hypothetical protein